MQNNDECKDLVREIIDEGLVDENIGGTITKDRQEIWITKPDNDSIRFDLPGTRKAYVLMSGRLYEKDFILDLSEPEPNEGPESSMLQQLDYKGMSEEVDTHLFKNRIECECGNIRWVKNADLFQVKKCKPCTYMDRLKRRKQRRTKV